MRFLTVMSIIIVTFLLLLTGCINIYTAEPLPTQKTALTQEEYDLLIRSYAKTYATSINAFNALNPDDAISEIPPLEELNQILGSNLAPTGISDANAQMALDMLEIVDGKAELGVLGG